MAEMADRHSSTSPPTQDLQEDAQLLRSRRQLADRPIYTQSLFDKSQELREGPLTPWRKLTRWTRRSLDNKREWHPSFRAVCLRYAYLLFPILRWLPQYNLKDYLPRDLITGFTVGIIQIRQGLAYALLAHVPPVVGLYTSFYPPLIYTLMCTSRHVSLGTFAITSIMMGTIIRSRNLSDTDNGAGRNSSGANFSDSTSLFEGNHTDPKLELMIATTVAVGMWQVLMGLLGLGYFGVYLSDQLVKGFTTGAACHVFTSQLISLLDLRGLSERSGPLKLVYVSAATLLWESTYIDIFENMHSTNVASLILALTCIVLLLLARYLFNTNEYVQARLPFRFPLPSELLVVIFAAVASYMMDLHKTYGVSIVGMIPMGLPAPRIPSGDVFYSILADSFPIAIVSFVVTLSLGKLYANKNNYVINANQELRAMGSANLIGGFFLCIPSTGSLGRTAVQTSMGGKTQVITLVSCVMVLIVIFGIAFLLDPLPKPCLASIIIVSLIGLLSQVTEVTGLWKVSAIDTSVFVVSLMGVVLLDVDYGLGVAVGWCLLTVIFRTQRPDVAVLGKVVHDIYKRKDFYKTAAEIPGVKIIRFESPLYFANADYFTKRLELLCGIHPSQKQHVHKRAKTTSVNVGHANLAMDGMDMVPVGVVSDHETLAQIDAGSTHDGDHTTIHFIVMDCSNMSFIDVNGIKAVKRLAKEYQEFDIKLYMASCKANVRENFALSGYSHELPADNFFVTIQDAVLQVHRMQTEASDSPEYANLVFSPSPS